MKEGEEGEGSERERRREKERYIILWLRGKRGKREERKISCERDIRRVKGRQRERETQTLIER